VKVVVRRCFEPPVPIHFRDESKWSTRLAGLFEEADEEEGAVDPPPMPPADCVAEVCPASRPATALTAGAEGLVGVAGWGTTGGGSFGTGNGTGTGKGAEGTVTDGTGGIVTGPAAAVPVSRAAPVPVTAATSARISG
jgi:hypothetical protein